MYVYLLYMYVTLYTYGHNVLTSNRIVNKLVKFVYQALNSLQTRCPNYLTTRSNVAVVVFKSFVWPTSWPMLLTSNLGLLLLNWPCAINERSPQISICFQNWPLLTITDRHPRWPLPWAVSGPWLIGVNTTGSISGTSL